MFIKNLHHFLFLLLSETFWNISKKCCYMSNLARVGWNKSSLIQKSKANMISFWMPALSGLRWGSLGTVLFCLRSILQTPGRLVNLHLFVRVWLIHPMKNFKGLSENVRLLKGISYFMWLPAGVMIPRTFNNCTALNPPVRMDRALYQDRDLLVPRPSH